MCELSPPPWLLYTAVFQERVKLKVGLSGERMYLALLVFVFVSCVVFLFATMAPGFTPAGTNAGVTGAGATLMITLFALMYATFITMELLFETGDLADD